MCRGRVCECVGGGCVSVWGRACVSVLGEGVCECVGGGRV